MFDRLYVMIFQSTTIWPCTVYLSSEHGGEWDSGIEGGDGGFSERAGELNTTLAATSINNTGGGELPW